MFWEFGLVARCLFFALLLTFSQAAVAQWPVQSCGFGHRLPVVITAGPTGHSSETRIDLTATDFPADYTFSTDANDVRVFAADDVTPVDFVVSDWNPAARTATLYVRLAPLAPGASEQVTIYVGDTSLGFGGNPNAVFPDVGVRLRSRVTNADPTSAATALAAFAAATSDVSDAVRPGVTGLTNRAIGGTNGNFGWCISAVLEVTAATAGFWEFRYGADFGRGGHLYVRGQALEEDWNDDLWWAGNFNNTAETLSGGITLPAGWHRYEALGFEGCCDGPVGFQARAPGGPWQDLTSANFALRGAQCIATTASVVVDPVESCASELLLDLQVDTDPGSSSPFFIPEGQVRYVLEVTNPGQVVDDSTVVLTQAFPSELGLVTAGPGVFEFVDGAVASGLTFSYLGPANTTDSVEFSIDGTNFNYVPSGPADMNVTHIRFTMGGAMAPNVAGQQPSFAITIVGSIP